MDKVLDYSILLGIFASIAMILFLLIYIIKKPSIFDKLIASDLLAMPLMCLIVLVSSSGNLMNPITVANIAIIETKIRSIITTSKILFSIITENLLFS